MGSDWRYLSTRANLGRAKQHNHYRRKRLPPSPPSKEDEEKEDKFSGLFLPPPSLIHPRHRGKEEARNRGGSGLVAIIKIARRSKPPGSSDTEANQHRYSRFGPCVIRTRPTLQRHRKVISEFNRRQPFYQDSLIYSHTIPLSSLRNFITKLPWIRKWKP